MKVTSRIFLALGCVVLLIISWAVVLGSKSDGDKQFELIERALALEDDGIYITAVPLLEEAANYNAAYTEKAETELKKTYLQLLDKSGFRRKYTDLLEKQMARKDAPPEVFIEAANFYLETSNYSDALVVLKNGIEKTASTELSSLYEKNRYGYRLGSTAYDDVTVIFGGTVGVCKNGLWGVATSAGDILIPCEYEKISTYADGRVIVRSGDVVEAVDISGNRVALLKESGVLDFGNFSNARIPLLTKDGWRRATGDFALGAAAFEAIGTYSNGYAAAKENGKWGVVDIASEWLIPPQYDAIIMDDIGRSYAQNAAFAQIENGVWLFENGVKTAGPFDEAKPFNKEGYAAAKQNGKWGFINATGEVVIDFKFEEADSFGQHLAAFKKDGLWGYINLYGDVAIEPIFLQAKNFENGSAPVLTERGWQFISLTEFEKGVSL